MAAVSNVPMPAPTASDVVMQACQGCRNVRLTRAVAFRRNVGMVVFRRTYAIRGNLCKSCISKYFWEFELKNLLLGPWGIISLIVTPVYLVWNFFTYIGAMSKLRGSLE